jgi:hypothetical protein
MKTITLSCIIAVFGALLFLGSCSDGVSPTGGTTLPKIDTFDCHPDTVVNPWGGYMPKNIPSTGDNIQRCSYDGRYLASASNIYKTETNNYNIVLAILDLQTGVVEKYDIDKMINELGASSLGPSYFTWCPYSNDRIAFMCVTGKWTAHALN